MGHTASSCSEILPVDACLRSLAMHRDARGVFAEIFREEWAIGMSPVQWNMTKSQPGVLRGVHAHIWHDDYFVLLEGHALIGLQDLRKGSPTEGLSTIVELVGDRCASLLIPHGVAHGFYFLAPSLHIYAVSEYWNVKDELKCHWKDPHLTIRWPFESADLSEHDAHAGSFGEMADQIEPWRPTSVASSSEGF